MTRSPQKACPATTSVAGLHDELPPDLSTFIGPLASMEPAYVQSATAAEQLPFLFWLCDAVSPKVIVDAGAEDATAYFGLCQAARALALDTSCVLGAVHPDMSTGTGNTPMQTWLDQQDAHYGAHSRIVEGDTRDLLKQLQKSSVDLLVLHAGTASSEQLQRWKSGFWPILSPHSVVFIDGLGIGPHDFFDELTAESPGFRFDHGTGFGVVAPMSSPPELMHHLCAHAKDKAGAEGLRALFRCLGLGCRQATDLELQEQLRTQLCSAGNDISRLREVLGLREARLVGREAEILELGDRLDWHREQLAEARRKLSSAQVDTHRDREAGEQLQARLRESKKKLVHGQAAVEQLQEQLQDARKALLKEKTALKKVQADLGNTTQQLRRERRKVHTLRNQLESLQSSRSWKLTAPLRWIMGRLRPDDPGT